MAAVLVGVPVGLHWRHAAPAAVEASHPRPDTALEFSTGARPLLEHYCFDCHGDGEARGGVSFDRFADDADAVRDVALWEKVRQHVSLHVMPPKGKRAPDADERRRLVEWIDRAVFAPLAARPDPGHVTMRRLNRIEYQNTIRDLLGVRIVASAWLPPDDAAHGFDHIGEAQSLPPLVLEKFLAAAEHALELCMAPPPPGPQLSRITPTELRGDGTVMADGLRLFTKNGSAVAVFPAPHAGEFVIRVRAYGHQAGSEAPVLRLEGAGNSREFSVPETHEAPGLFEAQWRFAACGHIVRIGFKNDFDAPHDPDPHRRERNLVVTGIEIEGPFHPDPTPIPDSHRRLFDVPVFAADPPGIARRAAATMLGRFAARAWRRPIAEDEAGALLRLFDIAMAGGDSFEDAVRVGFLAVLTSPHFLFHVEKGAGTAPSDAVETLDEFSLASRLSYFIWRSMPDAALVEDASRGRLRRDLGRHVRRLLANARSRSLTEDFAGQWLQLRDLDHIAPDPAAFPDFTPQLRASMKRETELVLEAARRGEISVPGLLDADFTFLDGRLARHYGLLGIDGGEFRRVSLAETPRRGLLGHASILTLTSHANRTSPTLRGKWVLESLLGMPPPPAPQDVPPIERPELKDFRGSFRERLALHRDNPSCAGCHDAMDPAGLALENFDAVGAWRETDAGEPIAADGQLVTGEAFRGADGLAHVLATSQLDAFLDHFARTLMTYALGRGLSHADRPAIKSILDDARNSNWTFEGFVMATVRSAPFQSRATRNSSASRDPDS